MIVTSAFWQSISALGNSKMLLPAVLVLIAVCGTDRWRIAQRWLPALGWVCLLTLLSKLAFMGWGWGIRPLDFTGVSGHAAVSSSIYPVALGLLLAPRWKWMGVVLGLVLALVIAYSRLPLHAHSPSEVLVGLWLGLSASLWCLRVLWAQQTQIRHKTLAASAALLISGIAANHIMPGVASHDVVVQLAHVLSGRETLYDREWLRHLR